MRSLFGYLPVLPVVVRSRDGKDPMCSAPEPLSVLSPGGSGRDHRPLDAAAAHVGYTSALERIDYATHTPSTHSDSGQPEADQRRQADAYHTPGWFEMACSYAECRVGSHPGQSFCA